MAHQKREGLFEEVYNVTRTIPKGKVATYGQIAKAVGIRDARKIGPRTTLTSRRSLPGSRSRGASIRGKWAISPRIVGFALHANRNPDVPCHRVVNKEGRLAPNFGASLPFQNRTSRRVRIEPKSREGRLVGDGLREQQRRLELEGVKFKDKNHVDLKKHTWKKK